MRTIQTSKTGSTVCLYISAVLNVLINYLMLTSYYSDMEKFNVYETILVVTYSAWQLANIVVSIYCAIMQSKAHQFELYCTVNMIAIGAISALALVTIIYFWVQSRINCSGEYCPVIDLLFMFIISLAGSIGISGFMMIYEAHKLGSEGDILMQEEDNKN